MTKDVRYVAVRAAYFMENWALFTRGLSAPQPSFPTLITPLDWKIPMVAIKEIGSTLAREVLNTSPGKAVFELHGPRRYSSEDVRAAFSKAIGKEVEVKGIEPAGIRDFYAQILPPDSVDLYTEMAKSLLRGGVLPPPTSDERVPGIEYSETELNEAIAEALKEHK